MSDYVSGYLLGIGVCLLAYGLYKSSEDARRRQRAQADQIAELSLMAHSISKRLYNLQDQLTPKDPAPAADEG